MSCIFSHHLLLQSVVHLALRLVDSILSFHILLNGLRLPTVEVQLLDLVDLAVESLDLKLVCIYLRLVIFELLNHFFQLIRSLLQVLLIHLQLLSNFRTWLLSQNIFQFDVQLFFLLDQHVLFWNFLRFGNQSLLKGLNFLNVFIGFWIGAFELPPSMNIEWLLKLVIEVLRFLLLLEVFLLEQVDFSLQVWDARCLVLRHDKLSL